VREAARLRLDGRAPAARLLAARFRAEHSAGLRAAAAMWTRTRERQLTSPNEQILQADLGRLRAWLNGEAVFGSGWQLCYEVENVAPAVQQVAVEEQQPDGTWRTLQACHTIEFQSAAATRRGSIVRSHAAPVTLRGESAPRLRLVLRGIGEVRIRNVQLCGPRRRPQSVIRSARLGQPAPAHGLPSIAWSEPQGLIELPVFAIPF
jgi:hypothetical protein